MPTQWTQASVYSTVSLAHVHLILILHWTTSLFRTFEIVYWRCCYGLTNRRFSQLSWAALPTPTQSYVQHGKPGSFYMSKPWKVFTGIPKYTVITWIPLHRLVTASTPLQETCSSHHVQKLCIRPYIIAIHDQTEEKLWNLAELNAESKNRQLESLNFRDKYPLPDPPELLSSFSPKLDS